MSKFAKMLGGAAAGRAGARKPSGKRPDRDQIHPGLGLPGPTSPFLVALEKGYYKAEGLDVTMDPGQARPARYSAWPPAHYQIGFADVNSTIEYNAKNPGKEVLCVFMVYDFAAVRGLCAEEERHQDAEGPRGQEARRAGVRRQLPPVPAFAKKNGFTKWEHVNLTPQLREQSLVQGTVDFISGHYFSSMLDLKARGVAFEDIVANALVDFGMDVYGNGVVISGEMARTRRP